MQLRTPRPESGQGATDKAAFPSAEDQKSARLLMSLALALALVVAAGAVVLMLVTAFLALTEPEPAPAPTPLLRTARATPRAAPPARVRRAPLETP
jgi:hypothetical protein